MVKGTTNSIKNKRVQRTSKSYNTKTKSEVEDKDLKQDIIKFDVQKTLHTYNTRKRMSTVKVSEQSPIKNKCSYREIIKNAAPVIFTSEKYEDVSEKYEDVSEKYEDTSDENMNIFEPVFTSLDEEIRAIQAAINRNVPEVLPGRENQLEELHDTLLACAKDKKSLSVYISGCPGSGKTITLKSLLNQIDITKKFKQVFINCMGMIKGSTVYNEIIKNLDKTYDDKVNKTASIERIEKVISKERKPTLIVLDEMDVLGRKNPSVLYSLFELTSKLPNGKLALIGVGNTLNFIEKGLPFLRFKHAMDPITFQFPSYNQHQIAEIISQRIKSVNAKQFVFSEPAIKLLAAKVASFGGDARAALGIASASIYHVMEKANKDSTDQVYTVGPQTIVAVMSSIYDTVEQFQNAQNSNQLDSFPLHQKLILCSLLLTLKKNVCDLKKLNILKIREMYKKVCVQRKMDTLNQVDFTSAFSLIEMNGIVSLGKGKNVGKVTLKWDQTEMMTALCKETLFGDILRND